MIIFKNDNLEEVKKSQIESYIEVFYGWNHNKNELNYIQRFFSAFPNLIYPYLSISETLHNKDNLAIDIQNEEYNELISIVESLPEEYYIISKLYFKYPAKYSISLIPISVFKLTSKELSFLREKSISSILDNI